MIQSLEFHRKTQLEFASQLEKADFTLFLLKKQSKVNKLKQKTMSSNGLPYKSKFTSQ